MRKIIIIGLLAVACYLLLWPVPVEPKAWDAPANPGLTGHYEPNERLAAALPIPLGTHSGPEDVAGGPDGLLYASTHDGAIIRLRPDGSGLQVFANTGGRPLGIEFDEAGNLLVANAYLGLQRVTPDGRVELLTDSVAGQRIVYADDVAVAANGNIFFSDASSKFGAEANGGSYTASLLDLLEHGGHGRILKYDPADRSTSVVMDGLNFANGVAVSEDQEYLLINETGAYRIWRYWLGGPRQGQSEVILAELPGFPDNVNNGRDGKFWIGLVSPRSQQLDALAQKPFLRKVAQRLPAFMRPKAVASSHVIAIDGNGKILLDLQDSSAAIPALTGVYEAADALYLSSLFGNQLGQLSNPGVD